VVNETIDFKVTISPVIVIGKKGVNTFMVSESISDLSGIAEQTFAEVKGWA